MSTDPKINLFAEDLFTALWRQHGLWTEVPPSKQPTVMSEFNEDILRGVEARQAMLHSPYKEIFEDLHAGFTGNHLYFFYAIDDSFPHCCMGMDDDIVMSVFLCSCAFVADMCMMSKDKGDDFLEVAPKTWAMFVDIHLKDAFYDAGGWEDLKIFAEEDLVVYDFIRRFSDLVNCKLGKNVLRHTPHLTVAAIESFHRFEDWKGLDDDRPMALAWVDYCVQEPHRAILPARFFRRADIMVCLELFKSVFDIGMICNPYYPEEDDDSDATERRSDLDDENSGIGLSRLKIDNRHFPTTKGLFSNDQRKEEYSDGYDSDATERIVSSPIKDLNGFECGSGYSEIDNDSSSSTSQTSHINGDLWKVEAHISGLRAVKLRATSPEHIRSESSEKRVKLFSVDETLNSDEIDEEKGSKCQNLESKKGDKQESLIKIDYKRSKSGIFTFYKDIVLNQVHSPEETTFQKASKMETEGKSISRCDKKTLNASSASSQSRLETDRVLKESLTQLDPEDFGTKNDHEDSQSQMNSSQNDMDAFMEQLGLKRISDHIPTDSKGRVQVYVSTLDSNDTTVPDDSVKGIPQYSLSTPCKSPLTPSEVNVLSHFCDFPLTSTNVNASRIVDGTLYKRNYSSPSISKRKGKRCTGKENFTPKPETKMSNSFQSPRTLRSDVSSQEVKSRKLEKNQVNKHTNNDSFCSKSLQHFIDGTDLSKTEGPSLKENDDSNEFENLSELNVKKGVPTKQFDKKIDVPSEDNTQNRSNVVGKSSLSHKRQTPGCLNSPYQCSIYKNDDENFTVLEKPLKTFEPEGHDEPSIGKESERVNRRLSQDSSSTEIYVLIEETTSEAENPSSVDSENPFKTRLNCEKYLQNTEEESNRKASNGEPLQNTKSGSTSSTFQDEKGKKKNLKEESNSAGLDLEALQTTESEISTAELVSESPFGFSGVPQDAEKKGKKEKSKKELDSFRLNQEPLQTTENETTTAESVVENPFGFPSKPPGTEKKGKRKKPKKRLSRLQERVKEDGKAIRDVMRLILVMGYHPGVEYVASTLQHLEKKKPECD